MKKKFRIAVCSTIIALLACILFAGCTTNVKKETSTNWVSDTLYRRNILRLYS